MKTCLIEVISGVEGPCLSVGTESGGTRIAGPKPWGGGRVAHSFEVSIDALIKELELLRQEKPPCQE